MYLLRSHHSSSSDDAFSVQYDVAEKLFEEIICVKHLQGYSKIPLDEMWPLVRLGRPVCHASVWYFLLLLMGTFYSTLVHITKMSFKQTLCQAEWLGINHVLLEYLS
jgi:hypothetical protein